MSVDVHLHVWTHAFVDALRARTSPPRVDGWTLLLDGEPPYEIDPEDRRDTTGLELALVSMSSPLGVELLPPEEAWPLIDAYHEGALALGEPFGAWASTCLGEPDPDRLAKDLDRGLAGLQVPATVLPDDRLLEVLTARDLPLFVHPGPAVQHPGAPPWWAAVVPYVQQLHAAWHHFHAVVRPRHPDLRVCFAALAGLAPLHSERLIARGGGSRGLVDPGCFVETSSYGPRAIDAIVRELGIDVVVNGSDAPYAKAPEPGLGAAAGHAIRVVNPRRLLNRKETRT
ncbi:amidohydrolase [Nonomuraea phyllanthi]|uniref:Amidohydrolase n=1 Tax=Nonomuraea phyllanthi TaxID=2219224 RepID=A0A5C4WFB9_9ACTN|nr:amidohydrolase [Nonomuraea phyllanthi]KAB8193564.1 amidohydrolase [Nonomuraea phyllanthi]QFY12305.1 amidohydrolase [Nonomuraea phyllanthi]